MAATDAGVLLALKEKPDARGCGRRMPVRLDTSAQRCLAGEHPC